MKLGHLIAVDADSLPPPGSVTLNGFVAAGLWICAALVAGHITVQCCVGRDLTMMVVGGLAILFCALQAGFAFAVWARASWKEWGGE